MACVNHSLHLALCGAFHSNIQLQLSDDRSVAVRIGGCINVDLLHNRTRGTGLKYNPFVLSNTVSGFGDQCISNGSTRFMHYHDGRNEQQATRRTFVGQCSSNQTLSDNMYKKIAWYHIMHDKTDMQT